MLCEKKRKPSKKSPKTLRGQNVTECRLMVHFWWAVIALKQTKFQYLRLWSLTTKAVGCKASCSERRQRITPFQNLQCGLATLQGGFLLQLKRKVLLIFICTKPDCKEGTESRVRASQTLTNRIEASVQIPDHVKLCMLTQPAYLCTWLCNSESQCVGTQLSLNVTFPVSTKSASSFHIAPWKCQHSKSLINDKTAFAIMHDVRQGCDYYPVEVWTPLSCQRAWAAGLRGEVDWLLPRSELK